MTDSSVPAPKKTLGAAVDSLIAALTGVEQGDALTAIRAACEHLGFSAPKDLGNSGGDASGAGAGSAGDHQGTADIRSFKEQKQPKSAIQMAVVMAYFLKYLAAEKKNEIRQEDIELYFNQANFPLPKSAAQLLVDTKTAGYLSSAGRGAYALNAVGSNLVAHRLPIGPDTRTSSSRSRSAKSSRKKSSKRR